MTIPFSQLNTRKSKIKRLTGALLISLSLHSPILFPQKTREVATYLDNHYDAFKLTDKREEIRKEAIQKLKTGKFDRGEFIIKALTLEDVIERTAKGEKLDFNSEWKKNHATLLKQRLLHADIDGMETADAMQELKKRTAGEGTAVYGAGQANALESVKSGVPIENCYSASLKQMALTSQPMQFEVFNHHVQPIAKDARGTWHSPYDGSVKNNPKGDMYRDYRIVDFYSPHNPFGSSAPFSFPSSSKKYDGKTPTLSEFKNSSPKINEGNSQGQARTSGFLKYVVSEPFDNLWLDSESEHGRVALDLIDLFKKMPVPKASQKFTFDESKPIEVEIDPSTINADVNDDFIERFPEIQRQTVLMSRFLSASEHLGVVSGSTNGAVYLVGAKLQAEKLKAQLNPSEFPEIHKKLDEVIRKVEDEKTRTAAELLTSLTKDKNESVDYYRDSSLGVNLYKLALVKPELAAKFMNENSGVLNGAFDQFAWKGNNHERPVYERTIDSLKPHLNSDVLKQINDLRRTHVILDNK